MIDSSPQIVLLTVDLHKHLVEVPSLMDIGLRLVNALPADVGYEHRLEPLPPELHGLIANIDVAPGQPVLNVAQRKRTFD